jgi:hypothetical protein
MKEVLIWADLRTDEKPKNTVSKEKKHIFCTGIIFKNFVFCSPTTSFKFQLLSTLISKTLMKYYLSFFRKKVSDHVL